MKTIIMLALALSLSLSAKELSFIGPCDSTPLASFAFEAIGETSVGKITIEILEENSIPYIGSEQGLGSIFETPTGLDALEIVSDREMYAYGWCYSVNDIAPSEYPNHVQVSTGDRIVWWFGYARYLDGQWSDQCAPSFERKSEMFCPQD